MAATRENIQEAIRLTKEYNSPDQIPDILKGEYEIVYKYDTQSLLQYYSGILTNAALERLTGINQKQLWNYANGLSKPREAQVRKIENALHQLGRELISVSL